MSTSLGNSKTGEGQLKNFEQVLERIGPCGKWQFLVWTNCFLSMMMFIIGMTAQQYFVAGKMESTRCLDSAISAKHEISLAAPRVALNGSIRLSSSSPPSYCSSENNRETCTNWEYSSEYYAGTVQSEWDLVCDRAYMLPLYVSSWLMGFLFGVPMLGVLSDAVGRRPVIWLSGVLILASHVGSALAPTYWWAFAMRFLFGFGLSGDFTAQFVLCMEITIPKHRNVVSCVQLASWTVATIIAGIVGYFIREWRLLQWAILLPAVAGFLFSCFVPESPRWLIMTSKSERAGKIIQRAARMNGRSQAVKAINLEAIEQYHKSEQQQNDDLHKSFFGRFIRQLSSLFVDLEMRKRVGVLSFIWTATGLVFYGIGFYTVNSMPWNPFLKVIIIGTARAASTWPQFVMLNYMGSRNGLLLALLSTTSLLLAVVCVPLLLTNVQWLELTLALAVTVTSDFMYRSLYIFTGELFPTLLRQSGYGLCSMFSRVGAIVSPFVADLLVAYWRALPGLIFFFTALIAALSIIILPQTSKKNLPETVVDASVQAHEPLVNTVAVDPEDAADDSYELSGDVSPTHSIERSR